MHRIGCAAIVLLFAAGGVTAQSEGPVPVDADFEVTGPVQLAGDVALDAELAGVLLHPGEDSAFELFVHDARVRLVNIPYRLVETHEESAVGAKSLYLGEQAEPAWERSWTGTIALAKPGGPESTIRIVPGPDGIRHAFHGNEVTLGPPTRLPTPSVDDHAALPAASMKAVAPGRIAPEGVYAAVHETDVSVAGAIRVVLYGGDYLMAGARGVEVATGHVLNSTVADPLGQAGTWRYDRFVLLIDVLDGEATLGKGDGQLDLLVRHVSGSVSGEMALHGVQGGLTADEEHVGGYALAQLTGNLTVDADYGSASTWVVTGEASYAALDAEPVFESRIGAHGPRVAEAAVASLLVAVAYSIVSFVRRGLVWKWVEAWTFKAWFVAPFGARIHSGNVMKVGKRRVLMRVLWSNPMAPMHETLRQASRILGASESAIRWHLNTLGRFGKLTFVTRGRRIYVGPNSGRLGPRDVQVALAFLSEKIPRAVAKVLAAESPLNQRQITGRVNRALSKDFTRICIRRYLEEMSSFEDVAHPTQGGAGQIAAIGTSQVVHLLRKEKRGRSVMYRPTEAVLKAVSIRFPHCRLIGFPLNLCETPAAPDV